jgi:hypothetical protein
MISPRPRKETIWESSLLCCWICLKWVPCIIIVKSFFCYQFCVPLTLQQCRMTRKQPEIGHIYLGRSTKLNQALPFQRLLLTILQSCSGTETEFTAVPEFACLRVSLQTGRGKCVAWKMSYLKMSFLNNNRNWPGLT